MKGVSLPINAMIILVLALIVLIAILAFYFGIWNPTSEATKLEAVKSTACQKLVSMGGCDSGNIKTESITISDFDADKDGTNDPGNAVSQDGSACGDTNNQAGAGDNLRMLCICNYFVGRAPEGDDGCKKICCT